MLAWFRMLWPGGFARLGKGRAERRMELVEVLQLGGKRQLMLVVCDGRRYLVGAGGDSVQSIAVIGGEVDANAASLEAKGSRVESVMPAVLRSEPGMECRT